MRSEEEIRDMVDMMKKGLREHTHQAPDGDIEGGIACLEWVLNDKGEK